jgi:hypothetical protein
MTLCKSLLDGKVFSLDVAQFPEATPENIKIGTPGLTTNFQPANAGNRTGTLAPARAVWRASLRQRQEPRTTYPSVSFFMIWPIWSSFDFGSRADETN